MKFIQSSLAKKLIIVLIALLLFNVAYPSMSYAVDIGGILLQPLYWLLLGIYIPADLTMGLTIFMKEFKQADLDGVIRSILNGTAEGDKELEVETEDEKGNKIKISYGQSLRDWFIGPDTIFSRKNRIS